LRKDYLH